MVTNSINNIIKGIIMFNIGDKVVRDTGSVFSSVPERRPGYVFTVQAQVEGLNQPYHSLCENDYTHNNDYLSHATVLDILYCHLYTELDI